MPRRYPKKRDRGSVRRATRQLRGRVTPDTSGETVDVFEDGEIVDDDRRRTGAPSTTTRATPIDPRFADDGERTSGVVIETASGCCWSHTDGGVVFAALPSRLAAHQRERVAAGDEVTLARAQDGAWWVHDVAPRRTELARPDPHNPRLRRVLAANVDIVVHVTSFKKPPLVPALLDRFLIAIAESGAAPLVAINKGDLIDPPVPAGDITAPIDHPDEEVSMLETYRRLGLPMVICAAKTGAGIDALRRHLRGKTAVLAGHSGVGKSSLVNALSGGELAAVGRVAGRGKGRHTTTRAALLHLDGGIRLIDTPGIRELGLWRLELADLGRHFPRIAGHAQACRFRDCSHLHEPGCAVRVAVEAGHLDAARLASYHRILASLTDSDPP